MAGFIEIIQKRRSVRTYDPAGLDGAQIEAVRAVIDAAPGAPFGNASRFELISGEDFSSDETRAFGTYGMIKGARAFVVGIVGGWDGSPWAMIDFGWRFEAIVLRLTALGLGTCWLGGTLHRSRLAARLGLAEGEIVPAMIPVGLTAGRMSLPERLLRLSASAARRKPWDELFFAADGAPLSAGAAGAWAEALECLRFAPSASNRQPWRVLRGQTEDVWHIFIERTPGYQSAVKAVDLQAIDVGIAMCHFEMAAAELDLPGSWRRLDKAPAGRGEYLISWTTKGGAA